MPVKTANALIMSDHLNVPVTLAILEHHVLIMMNVLTSLARQMLLAQIQDSLIY